MITTPSMADFIMFIMFEVCLERRDGSSIEPFLMRDRASLQNLITIFYKIDVSRRGFYFCFSFKRDFLFWKTMKHLLFILWRRERTKRHPPPPSRPLYWAGVTENRGNRRFVRVLVWLSSLCPYGVSHGCLSAGA